MFEQFTTNPLFREVLWGNTLGAYVDSLILFLVCSAVAFVFHRSGLQHIQNIASKTSTKLDDLLVGVVSNISPLFYFGFIAFGSVSFLDLPTRANQVMVLGLIVITAWQLMRVIDSVIVLTVRERIRTRESSAGLENASDILIVLIKIALWGIAGLLILSNLGVNITALVASVGIGGIAIAFAVKGILEDLFSSFSIYLDKPFGIGDTIAVDDEKGIVQKIGIKTTRLKSLSTGEEIVMANTDLTTKKIHNFHKMKKRRVSFDLGVTYETPTKRLEEINLMIKNIIEKEDGVEFNRSHFRHFGDSALIFSVLYHVNSRDYEKYLFIHERVLFGIRKAFEKKGIDMAYPTQTVYLHKNK